MLMTLRRVLSEPWIKFQCRDLGFDRVVVGVPHRSWEHFNHCGLLHQSPHEQHCSRTKSYQNIDQNDSSWLWTWLSWHNTALHGTTCDLMRTKPEIHLTFLLVDSWDVPKKTSTSYSSIKRVPLACVAISGSWAAMTRSRHAAVELTTVRQVREKKAPQIPWWISIFSLQKKIWHPTSPISGSTHSNLPRSGPQRCLLQVPVERWMGRQEPTCYLLIFAQLLRPLENAFHSRECKLLNHKVQTDNKHCATLARIFNQGTAIAKQNQHFILSVNLYHISDWEAESVKDLPPEPTHDESWIMWCITLRYPL